LHKLGVLGFIGNNTARSCSRDLANHSAAAARNSTGTNLYRRLRALHRRLWSRGANGHRRSAAGL